MGRIRRCFHGSTSIRRPDVVLAAKAHGDASTMTYLVQDKDVEGLQTLKDGQWYKVPIVPNAIVVNVGDQIEVISPNCFTSTSNSFTRKMLKYHQILYKKNIITPQFKDINFNFCTTCALHIKHTRYTLCNV